MERMGKEKDPEITKLKETMETFFSTLKDILTRMDLDEIADTYSKRIDEYILQSQKTKGLNFISGMFTITYVTAETFSLTMELYYQNQEKEWIKEESKTARSTKYLKREALAKLKEEKKIIYEINPPKSIEA